MINRNNNDNLDGLTVRQYILNERSTAIQEAADTAQLGIFAGIFGGLIPGLGKITEFLLFIGSTLMSWIREGKGFQYFFKNKNKNASGWFNTLLNGILLAVETSAIVIALAAFAGVAAFTAPAMFVAMIGTKLFKHLGNSIYHGFQCLKHMMQGTTYTKEYEYHKNAFKGNMKGVAILTTALVVIGFALLIPAALPTIVIGSLFALSVKSVGVGVLGSFCLLGVPKPLKNLWNWASKKISGDKNNSQNKSNEKPLSDSQKEQYKHSAHFKTINTHIDDLIRKLDILHDEKPQSAKSFLLSLMKEEGYRIKQGIKTDNVSELENNIKFQALKNLIGLINGPIEIEGKTITTVTQLIKHYESQNNLQPILRSYFADIGGMQKIFVLADHYLQLRTKANHAPSDSKTHLLASETRVDSAAKHEQPEINRFRPSLTVVTTRLQEQSPAGSRNEAKGGFSPTEGSPSPMDEAFSRRRPTTRSLWRQAPLGRQEDQAPLLGLAKSPSPSSR